MIFQKLTAPAPKVAIHTKSEAIPRQNVLNNQPVTIHIPYIARDDRTKMFMLRETTRTNLSVDKLLLLPLFLFFSSSSCKFSGPLVLRLSTIRHSRARNLSLIPRQPSRHFRKTSSESPPWLSSGEKSLFPSS